jgi:hypothetical protein
MTSPEFAEAADLTQAPTGPPPDVTTLGQLRASGWQPSTVAAEIRRNAATRIAAGQPLVPGVLGFEDTVLPQLENAVLAGHDIILLGERGQAKTRLIRSLVGLLDEWLPIVAHSEINDDPFAPVSRYAKDLVAEQGDDTPGSPAAIATARSWPHRTPRSLTSSVRWIPSGWPRVGICPTS